MSLVSFWLTQGWRKDGRDLRQGPMGESSGPGCEFKPATCFQTLILAVYNQIPPQQKEMPLKSSDLPGVPWRTRLGKVTSEQKPEGGWIGETGSSVLAVRARVRGFRCLEPRNEIDETGQVARPPTVSSGCTQSQGTIGDFLQVMKSGCGLGNFLQITVVELCTRVHTQTTYRLTRLLGC